MFIFRAFPGRDVPVWMTQFKDPSTHAQLVRQYFIYKTDLHNIVRQRSDLRK